MRPSCSCHTSCWRVDCFIPLDTGKSSYTSNQSLFGIGEDTISSHKLKTFWIVSKVWYVHNKAIYIELMLLLTHFTLKLIIGCKTIRTLLYTKTIVEEVTAHLSKRPLLIVTALETNWTVGTFCIVRIESVNIAKPR